MKDPVEQYAEGSQEVRGLIAIHEGRVTLGFQVAIDHYAMPPTEAVDMAIALMETLMDPDIEPEIIVAQIETNVGQVPLVQLQPLVGTTPDGKVIIDFRRKLNFLKLRNDEVTPLAKGLERMAKLAAAGVHVVTGDVLNPSRR